MAHVIFKDLTHNPPDEHRRIRFLWKPNENVNDMFDFQTYAMAGKGRGHRMMTFDGYLIGKNNQKYLGNWPMLFMRPWFDLTIIASQKSSLCHEIDYTPENMPKLNMERFSTGSLRFIGKSILNSPPFENALRTRYPDLFNNTDDLPILNFDVEWLFEAFKTIPNYWTNVVCKCPPLVYLLCQRKFETLFRAFEPHQYHSLLVMNLALVEKAYTLLFEDPYQLCFGSLSNYDIPELSSAALKKHLGQHADPTRTLAVDIYQEMLKREAISSLEFNKDIPTYLHYFPEQQGDAYSFLPTIYNHLLIHLPDSTKVWPGKRSREIFEGSSSTEASRRKEKAKELRRTDIVKNMVDKAIHALCDLKVCVLEDRLRLYLTPVWQWEERIVKAMHKFTHLVNTDDRKQMFPINDTKEHMDEFLLNSKQRELFNKVLHGKSPIVLLTGKGGTGKTHVLQALLDVVNVNKRNTLFAAAVGRAAAVISETTGFDACTIHHALKKSPAEWAKAFGDAKVLVIDEMSMLATELFACLLERVLKECPRLVRIILVGDPKQLPPITEGELFEALLSLDELEQLELVENMRSGADIVYRNALALQHMQPEKLEFDEKTYFSIECGDPEQQKREIDKFILKHKNQGWHIISSTNVVIKRANNTYYDTYVDEQKRTKPWHKVFVPEEHKSEMRKHALCYPLGSKVAFHRNIHELDVTNGTVMTVDEYHDEKVKDTKPKPAPSKKGKEEAEEDGYAENMPEMPGEDEKVIRETKRPILHLLDQVDKKWTRVVHLRNKPSKRNKEGKVIQVNTNDWNVKRELDVAAATTIYKFEGSEEDHVLFVLAPGDWSHLTWKHIYVAFTRARGTTTFLGRKEDLYRAVKRPWIPRKCTIADRFRWHNIDSFRI